ncbi:hypothetical protein F2Q69_00055337 [Brassica cretica]|uniref:Secreted protein n=1 Tax=Brassica cretica TaxID=69181 RepID=A0A8S9MXV7_BRACR|nr:hypothetical protein F2Q69_00055337 [Brassica cretica]
MYGLATLLWWAGGLETSGLATQIVWGVGAETFAVDAALEDGGTKIDCTSDAAYPSCLFMLELKFHSGSSIYSSQWFACLASHTSRSNSPVTHSSFHSPFQVQRVVPEFPYKHFSRDGGN